jgi:hypothetical protein
MPVIPELGKLHSKTLLQKKARTGVEA